jgi:hypothetical protein
MRLARRLAKRVLARWVWLETYRCLRLPWDEAQAAADDAAPQALEFRPVERSELLGYGARGEHDFSPPFLQGLASRDDLCYGAFASGQLVAYCFFAVMPTAIDAQLRFHFPERWIYVYKAFTHPSWRGRRLQPRLFVRALPQVGQWAKGMREPLGFVTLVAGDNTPSLSAFARIGFVRFETFPVLRLRSRPRVLRSAAGDDAKAFYIEAAAAQGR